MEHIIKGPIGKAELAPLRAGERIYYTGVVYTARDAAHKRLSDMLSRGEALPFPIENAIIYYAGPAPAAPGAVIGPVGPTTSQRMDAYTPALLDAGLAAMIGKGDRSGEVRRAIAEHGACYLAAVGGAAAKLARCVKSCEVVCFKDLGTEAVRRLEVEAMPLVVAIDSTGADWYELGRKSYLDSLETLDKRL